MRFLFISFVKNKRRYQDDPSFIYRCQNVALALGRQGVETKLAHLDTLGLGMLRDSDCVVLHRPHFSAKFRILVALLRKLGKRIVADYDDLVFDPDYAEYSPACLNALSTLSEIRRKYRLHRRALEYIDAFTVSTEPLMHYLQRCRPGARVAVMPNAVHLSWEEMRAVDASVPRNRKVIAYMSGTRSHDRDFIEVKSALEKLLSERNDLEFRVIGRLDFDLEVSPEKIVRIDRLSYSDYGKSFGSVDVNIAPLEDTPFNQCKSALKAIEAGFWGVPTVASKNMDYDRVQSAGVWGVQRRDEWYDQLRRALEAASQSDARARISQENRKVACADAVARQFASFCEHCR